MNSNFLTTLLLLVSLKLGSAQTSTQALLPIIKACAALHQINLQDIPRLAAASEDTVSDNYKCFIKCQFESIGLISMGKFDASRLKNSQDPRANIIRDCDKAVHLKGYDVDNECDYSYKLSRCITEGLKGHLKQQESRRNSTKARCASLTGFELSEINQLEANGYQNAKQSFKCYVNCVFEQEKLLPTADAEQPNQDVLHMRAKECHTDIDEKGFKQNADECEFAYQLLLCIAKMES